MPSMMIGAGVGRLYAEFIRYYFEIISFDIIIPGFYSLMGAACMVTGITRLMITVIVIFYEITNRSTTCIPLMVAMLICK